MGSMVQKYRDQFEANWTIELEPPLDPSSVQGDFWA